MFCLLRMRGHLNNGRNAEPIGIPSAHSCGARTVANDLTQAFFAGFWRNAVARQVLLTLVLKIRRCRSEDFAIVSALWPQKRLA